MPTWKEKLADKMDPQIAEEIDVFETQLVLRRQGKIDEKLFAETRLRHEEATATVGGTPMKMSSGVSRKPPPTPNTPERNPTAAPRPSRTKMSSDTSAIGR